MPTTEQLANAIEVSPEKTANLLEGLRENSLIREALESPDGQRHWRLSGWGKRLAYRLVGFTGSDIVVLDKINELKIQEKIRRPTITQLSEILSLPKEDIEAALTRLLKFGLVAESRTEIGGWRVRNWGRAELISVKRSE